MAERAWTDVIGSGRYSYQRFVAMTDWEIEATLEQVRARADASPIEGAGRPAGLRSGYERLTPVTSLPVRWPPPSLAEPFLQGDLSQEAMLGSGAAEAWEPPSRWTRLRHAAVLVWSCVPEPARAVLRPIVNGVLRPLARAMHGAHSGRLRRRRQRIGA
jgi:hypothetical protein